MSKFKLSYYTIITDVLDESIQNPIRIIYSTLSGQAITISDSIVQNLINEKFENISNQTLLKLIEFEFIVPHDYEEFPRIIKQNKLSLDDNNVLGVTMQPGANCQLGCHYCGQVHSKNYLSDSLYDSLLTRITHNLSNKNYKSLYVTWYGGEPLMALKQIRDLSSRFKSLADSKGIGYEAGMISNGLSMKNDIFEELVVKHNLRFFQITIDGMAENHDKRRITKTGEKTFDIIFKHVVQMVNNPIYSEYNCLINIRINIDSTNYESVLPFLNLLHENNLQGKVRVQFAPIANWGGNNAGEASLTREDFAVIEIDWLMHAIKLGFNFELIPTRSYQTCMVIDKDQEVYDAYGNIYPCWEFPYTPSYEKGEFLIGNIQKPYETFNENAITRNWYDEVQEGNTWCLKCKFFPVCGGSCPKQWYEGTPPCPSYKVNMEDKLVLQYMIDKNKFKEVF
ncbi:MAG: radical SAM protein [Bacteroidia bacterium]